MGSKIYCKSQKRKGTKFYFYLPLVKERCEISDNNEGSFEESSGAEESDILTTSNRQASDNDFLDLPKDPKRQNKIGQFEFIFKQQEEEEVDESQNHFLHKAFSLSLGVSSNQFSFNSKVLVEGEQGDNLRLPLIKKNNNMAELSGSKSSNLSSKKSS